MTRTKHRDSGGRDRDGQSRPTAVNRRPRVSAWIGGFLVAVAVLGAVLAPLLAPVPPNVIDLSAQLDPPSASHPLGTDFFGRDLASRIMYGGRSTLAVALAATALAVLCGVPLGLLAGYSRGWVSQAFVGLVDLLLAFPALLLALMVVAVRGPGLASLALAVGVAGIPGYARLARSIVLTLRGMLYVQAAQAIGAGPGRILTRHLLPGVIRPVVALGTADLGRAIISVAALGFLGLGASAPRAEWGLMLFEGRGYIALAPWASLVPGLAIALTVLGATLLGDSLSDA